MGIKLIDAVLARAPVIWDADAQMWYCKYCGVIGTWEVVKAIHMKKCPYRVAMKKKANRALREQ